MIGYSILAFIIIILLFISIELFNEVEHMEYENKEYYRKLRYEFDCKLAELKKDIDIRDDIIEGYKCLERSELNGR